MSGAGVPENETPNAINGMINAIQNPNNTIFGRECCCLRRLWGYACIMMCSLLTITLNHDDSFSIITMDRNRATVPYYISSILFSTFFNYQPSSQLPVSIRTYAPVGLLPTQITLIVT